VPETPEPPMVIRVDHDVPFVLPGKPKLPQPGFLLAVLLTLCYWLALIGSMIALLVVVVLCQAVLGEKGAPEVNSGADAGSVESLSPVLRAALAWSFPAGYLGGLVFSIIVLFSIVGRNWIRDLGLTRLPPYHLMLGMLALPGFIILSDLVAGLAKPIDDFVTRCTGLGGVGDTAQALRVLFQDSHWSFAVLAIGIGPGLVEELWCRGFLGRGFIARYGWFAGIALSSLFFGMLHLWPISYVIVTAFMGACLHFAYVTSRSLWVPIAMHLVNNSFAALIAIKIVPGEEIETVMLTRPTPIIVAAACLLLFCGLAMWHSRWTWPGEMRGVLIPPKGSSSALTAAKPAIIYTMASIGFCAVLIGLFCV
ncbi:MAG TPA: type II CAAX endopeptidase family protein, partial [Urbifossiella sp.]